MTVKRRLITQIETLPEEAAVDFLDHLHLLEIEEADLSIAAAGGLDRKMDGGEYP